MFSLPHPLQVLLCNDRRTDKIGTDGQLHIIEEYMEQVEVWFRQYEIFHPGPPTRRRIYLATDEPKVRVCDTNTWFSFKPSGN